MVTNKLKTDRNNVDNEQTDTFSGVKMFANSNFVNKMKFLTSLGEYSSLEGHLINND